MTTNIVLGGGIAGIAAAYFARKAGRAPVVFEAEPRAGGLIDNFTVDGYRFDNAVHLSFASEPEVRAVFDQTPYVSHDAVSLCWDAGFWLKHPTQNNMFALPVEQKIEMISGLVEQPEIEIKNYRDWLIYQYGGPIAARWPLVYTEKYWTLPAEALGTAWIGKRMRRADLREVLFGAFTEDTPNTYYVSQMRYPVRGGYRAFAEPMLADVEVVTGARATQIDHRARTVRFADGRQAEYDRMVSTLPLPQVVAMMSGVPADVRAAAETLFATEIDLISVGFNREIAFPSLWFYIYDTDILAARAYSPSLKSPDNAPPGRSSLQFEIYSSSRRPQAHSVEALKENTLMALQRMNIASPEDAAFLHHKRLPYGNVVFDLGMEERRNLVRAWLADVGIVTAGRFGEWDYLWSNQAMLSGMRAAEHFA